MRSYAALLDQTTKQFPERELAHGQGVTTSPPEGLGKHSVEKVLFGSISAGGKNNIREFGPLRV